MEAKPTAPIIESNLTTNILATLDDFVRLQNEQDLPGILQLIHQQSIFYHPTQQLLLKLFASHELKLTLVDRTFIAMHEQHAFAKQTIRTEKLAGPDFQDNTAESLVVFKRLGDQWKIWSQAHLDVHMHKPG